MLPRLPGLVVFDLDGTLVDSRRDLADAANALIRELGGTPLDEQTLGSMIGYGMAPFVCSALAAGCGLATVPPSLLDRFSHLYRERLLRTTLPYPGIRRMLGILQREIPLAVLTNKPKSAAIHLLHGLHLLPHFAEVIADDGTRPRKPDPAGLLHLLRLAEVSAPRCLLVGDSSTDWTTARRAGTGIALARYGYGYDTFPLNLLEGDEVLLDRPEQLAHYLGLA